MERTMVFLFRNLVPSYVVAIGLTAPTISG